MQSERAESERQVAGGEVPRGPQLGAQYGERRDPVEAAAQRAPAARAERRVWRDSCGDEHGASFP